MSAYTQQRIGLAGTVLCALAAAPLALAEDGTSQTYNDGGVHATGSLTVGNTGDFNTLNISAATTVNTTGTGILGVGAATNDNTATVTGGSLWTVSSFIFVGEGGDNNTLDVNGGADVTSGSTFDVGRNAGATGNQMLVSGTGSTVSPGGVFAIGRSGDGNFMTISAGGVVTNSSSADVGSASDNNIVTVTGTGSQWTSTGELIVGNASTASGNQLLVTADGTVLAQSALMIGQSGTGNLMSITGGGQVTSTGNMLIGRFAGSTGNSVTVSGTDSTLTTNALLLVGTGGDANVLTVSAGGLVDSNSGATVGSTADNSLATITGPDSEWTVAGELIIGDASTAAGNQVLVTDGASVSVASAGFVGQSGSNNSLTIEDGGQMTVSGNFLVSRFSPASGNSVLVTGEGSQLTGGAAATLFVASTGGLTGSVTVTNGGTLAFNNYNVGAGANRTITNTGGVYQFGNSVPSITNGTFGNIKLTDGTIAYRNVAGANINNAQVNNIQRAGNNTFRLDNSTNSAIASYTFDSVANTGNPNIYQRLELRNGGAWTSTTLNVGTGGAVIGNGTITAATSVAGLISPGLSPGQITINGNLTLASTAAYFVEVESATAGTGYDQLVVNGNVDLGLASLLLGAARNVNYGDVLTIINNLGGSSVTSQFAGLGEGATVLLSGSPFATISYQGGTGNDVVLQVIPEPATAVALVAGMIAMVKRRGRPA